MIILGTNSIKDTGYDVANSCVFDSATDAHMHITYGSAGNQKKWSWSGWVKRGTHYTTQQNIFSTGTSNVNFVVIYFSTAGKLTYYDATSTATTAFLDTNAQFRDPGAWMHILVSIDTTLSTANNRQRIWVNGTEQTSFANRVNYDQNTDTKINGDVKHLLGGSFTGTTNIEFDGHMAEVVFQDGVAHTGAGDFGEFDSDSGIWKPINVSGLTFGSNGFYLDFEDSSALGNDISGNNNDLTVSAIAATDQSTDTCTNNFATLNPLTNEDTDITISEGNLNYANSGSGDETIFASIGVSSGKWYFETKWIDTSNYMDIGVGSADEGDIGSPRADAEGTGYYMIQLRTASPGTRPFDNGSAGSGLGNSSANDINMFAIDMDNNKFYAGKNGTWYSSGDPANNSNPLITMDDGYTTLIPIVCGKSDSAVSVNFGSPSYAISSGNTDGNGYGNFEYAVPSGYYALNTKNLAEYG